MSARAALVLALATVAACNHTRLVVPVEPAGQACADQCAARELRIRNPNWYRTCVAGCPGARVDEGRCGAPDQAPAAACIEDVKLKPIAAAAVAVGVIAVIAAGVVALALGGLDDTIGGDR